MEQVRLVYEQIEEAKRYLLGGSLLQLRLALILLDNAAELMMYRELQHQFAWDDHRLPNWEPARAEWIRAGSGPRYTEEERQRSEREFEFQIRILCLRLGRISEADRKVLCVCHKLRREAFHRGDIRTQILGQVCSLLYLTTAELTVKLPFKSYAIPGGDQNGENTAFLARFGIADAYTLGTDEGRARLRDKLIEGVVLESGPFAEALSDDLVERIDETLGGLNCVVETNDSSEIDYKLQHTQFWRELGASLMGAGVWEPQLGEEFKAWRAAGRARFTLTKIRRWQRMATAIRCYANPASALDHYWAIDKRFSPLERDVAEAVYQYDEDVNMEAHARRLRQALGRR
jgi:hypothetical protein